MTALNELAADRFRFTPLGGQIDPALTYPVAFRSHAAIETGAGADPAVRRIIAAHPLLGSLSGQDRAALLRGATIRGPKRQDVICYQGDPATHVILVLDGFVKLSATLADGSEVFLEIAGPGTCTGELLALRKRVHDADATALSDCRVLMIDARQFRQTFDHRPEGLMAILCLADRRLQAAVERLLDSRARTAPVRLAKALLEVARLPTCTPGDGARLPLRLSQSELGVMAGMSREMVNKHLAVWRDAGWIRMCGGTVASIDADALSAMCSEDVES
jgi:CRP/FNR family transcriptional regulator, cyclic AMP receptor protein